MANLDILQNMVEATVTSGGTDSPLPGTVETFTVTTTEDWTVLGADQQMRVMDIVDANSTSNYEIMLATVNANGTGVSWTVTRGVEGTTPKAHAANWTMIPAFTAAGVPNSINALTNPMTTAGDLITATTGGTPERLAIGANGTVLGVASGALDYITPFTNPMTTAGDLITAGSGGTPERLGIGSDGDVLGVVSGALTYVSSFTNPMTTAGDLIIATTGGTPARLGIGSTNQVLTVVEGVPAWANASGGGQGYVPVTSPAGGDTAATTLTAADLGAERQAGANIPYTIPSDATLGSAFVQGQGRFFIVRALNTFAATLAAASGVTLLGVTSVASNQTAYIEEVAADTWVATASGSGGGGGGTGAGSLLARTAYVPASPYTTASTTFAAVDSTNLVLAFTTPLSGPGSTSIRVTAEVSTTISGSGGALKLGWLGTGAPSYTQWAALSETTEFVATSTDMFVDGLTPNTAYSWELAWAVNSIDNTGSINGNGANPIWLCAYAGLD